MAIDRKLKNKAMLTMKVLGIEHDTWLNEQYKNIIDNNEEEFQKKVEEMLSAIND